MLLAATVGAGFLVALGAAAAREARDPNLDWPESLPRRRWNGSWALATTGAGACRGFGSDAGAKGPGGARLGSDAACRIRTSQRASAAGLGASSRVATAGGAGKGP